MQHSKLSIVFVVCIIAILLATQNFIEAASLQKSQPSGIGVIGDSFSEGYRCIGRGGPDSYAWTEVAQDWRGINFGPMCNGYNVASSGETTAAIVNQTAELFTPIQNNEIGKVIIIIGGNDVRPVCDRLYSTSEIEDLQNNMLARLEAGVIDLMNAGMSPSNLYMVNQLDRSQIKACSYAAQVTNFVQSINVDIEAMANNHGIHLIAFQAALDELETYRIADGNFNIAGYLVKNEYCDQPDCFMVADGHVNTVTSGIVFNSLFANVLGVPRLTDEEIVIAAGLKPPHTPTPTNTAVSTPTSTPTDTAVSNPTTPTPTNTAVSIPTSTPTNTAVSNPPAFTPTSTPTDTAVSNPPAFTPTPTPTNTAVSNLPAYTPTPTPTNSPILNPTVIAEPTATNTAVPTTNPANSNTTYFMYMPIVNK